MSELPFEIRGPLHELAHMMAVAVMKPDIQEIEVESQDDHFAVVLDKSMGLTNDQLFMALICPRLVLNAGPYNLTGDWRSSMDGDDYQDDLEKANHLATSMTASHQAWLAQNAAQLATHIIQRVSADIDFLSAFAHRLNKLTPGQTQVVGIRKQH